MFRKFLKMSLSIDCIGQGGIQKILISLLGALAISITTSAFASLEQYLETSPGGIRVDEHLVFTYPRPTSGEVNEDDVKAIGDYQGSPAYGSSDAGSDSGGGGGNGGLPTAEDQAKKDKETLEEQNRLALFRLLDSLDKIFQSFFDRTSVVFDDRGSKTTYFDKDGNVIRVDEDNGACVAIGSSETCKKIVTQRIDDKIVIQIMPLYPTKVRKDNGTIGYTLVAFASDFEWIVVDENTGPDLAWALAELYIYEEIDTLIDLDFPCEGGKFRGETWHALIPNGYEKWTCSQDGFGNKSLVQTFCNGPRYELSGNKCIPHSCDGYVHGTRFLHETIQCTGTRGQHIFKTCDHGTWEFSYESFTCGSGGSGGGSPGRGDQGVEPGPPEPEA